jgi:hypothetical protein
VAQDRVGTEHAELLHPGDGCLAVAAEHLVELDDRLGGVHLVGPARLVGPALAIPQQRG